LATVKQKILNLLQGIDRLLTPKEIASFTKTNYNTVRRVLTSLVRDGLVVREFRGHYRLKPIHGLGSAPRVQNLFVVAEGVGVRRSEVFVWEFGGVEGGFRVRVLFGVKRGRVSWSVRAPLGLDLYGLRLVRRVVELECEKRGYRDLKWMVRNYELLWDERGIRFEGVKAVTLEDLDGTMEKYYNKHYGVRREVRSSRPTRIEDLVALVQGGLPTYQVVQGVGVLEKRIDELTRAIKEQNRLNYEMFRIQQANQEALYRLIDKIGKLMEKLGDNV